MISQLLLAYIMLYIPTLLVITVLFVHYFIHIIADQSFVKRKLKLIYSSKSIFRNINKFLQIKIFPVVIDLRYTVFIVLVIAVSFVFHYLMLILL